jgi:hypothetical protein
MDARPFRSTVCHIQIYAKIFKISHLRGTRYSSSTGGTRGHALTMPIIYLVADQQSPRAMPIVYFVTNQKGPFKYILSNRRRDDLRKCFARGLEAVLSGGCLRGLAHRIQHLARERLFARGRAEVTADPHRLAARTAVAAGK